MKFELTELPISEKRFKELLSASFMINTRLGTGGPQDSEVRKMLDHAKRSLESDQAWIENKRQVINRRKLELNRLFEQL